MSKSVQSLSFSLAYEAPALRLLTEPAKLLKEVAVVRRPGGGAAPGKTSLCAVGISDGGGVVTRLWLTAVRRSLVVSLESPSSGDGHFKEHTLLPFASPLQCHFSLQQSEAGELPPLSWCCLLRDNADW